MKRKSERRAGFKIFLGNEFEQCQKVYNCDKVYDLIVTFNIYTVLLNGIMTVSTRWWCVKWKIMNLTKTCQEIEGVTQAKNRGKWDPPIWRPVLHHENHSPQDPDIGTARSINFPRLRRATTFDDRARHFRLYQHPPVPAGRLYNGWERDWGSSVLGHFEYTLPETT